MAARKWSHALPAIRQKVRAMIQTVLISLSREVFV